MLAFPSILWHDWEFAQDVASEIAALSKQLHDGDFSKLKDARKAVLGLEAPLELVEFIFSEDGFLERLLGDDIWTVVSQN